MDLISDWNCDLNDAIIDILEDFGIFTDSVRLIKFEKITPDSFIWVFNLDFEEFGDASFCLYAEDYVPSLDHVRQQMQEFGHSSYWTKDEWYNLIKSDENESWGESSPVVTSTVYEPPDDRDSLMKYATTNGNYFVFLGSTNGNE